MSPVPTKSQILVIGGGPAGSYSAACLAQEGLEVTLLEADKFPRYHVGESQLASSRHFLRYVGLDEQLDKFGFQRKNGAAFLMNPKKKEGYTDFIASDPNNYSWNVIRSDFDDLIMRNASRVGANVIEETKVTDIEFDNETESRKPIAALWKNKAGETGRIAFDYIVDASGRNGLLSTKYYKTRTFNSDKNLKNLATWGYWRGCGKYAVGTSRENSPYFEALQDQSGWCWFIPLHDGTNSVGLVQNNESTIEKKAKYGDSKEFYLAELKQNCPNITQLIGEGKLVEDGAKGATIKAASDYSYAASSYAGVNYRIIGDAGAFIDPYFSSGVHLAFSGGLAAAASINSVIRGETDAKVAAEWHTTRVGTAYTRFLVVVLSAYQQIKNQNDPVLSDINEGDFDRAFGHFRQIIQGKTDTVTTSEKSNLSTEELRATLDFCTKAFEDDGDNEADALNSAGESASSKAKGVLRMHDTFKIDNLVAGTMEGTRLRLEKGNLGIDVV